MSDQEGYRKELGEWLEFGITLSLIILIKHGLCIVWLSAASWYEYIAAQYITDPWVHWLMVSLKQWVLMAIEVLFYAATLIAVFKFVFRPQRSPPRGPWWKG